MKDIIIVCVLLTPFIGTALGSCCVLFMKKQMNKTIQTALSGFAAGVMIAASVWSLLIPCLELSSNAQMGKLSFLPAAIGFCLGMLFLLFLDNIIPHMHIDETVEGPKSKLQKSTMLFFAVVLHNIPEGMAVGILLSGYLSGIEELTRAGTWALAIGIAIQNFPEGAIVSMPLHSKGISKTKACFKGIISGAVEPIAGLLTILFSSYILPVLPYLLSFAAGAMIYVVVEELIPEMVGKSNESSHSNIGTILFTVGFTLMMVLDVALG